MKIDWKQIDATKLVELNYDLTRKNLKLILPKNIKGAIIKVNFVLSKATYKQNVMDSIMDKMRERGATLVFVGKIKVKDDRRVEEEEKSLPLSLSRSELIREFAKMFAPKKLKDKIIKEAQKIQEESDA